MPTNRTATETRQRRLADAVARAHADTPALMPGDLCRHPDPDGTASGAYLTAPVRLARLGEHGPLVIETDHGTEQGIDPRTCHAEAIYRELPGQSATVVALQHAGLVAVACQTGGGVGTVFVGPRGPDPAALVDDPDPFMVGPFAFHTGDVDAHPDDGVGVGRGEDGVSASTLSAVIGYALATLDPHHRGVPTFDLDLDVEQRRAEALAACPSVTP